MPKPLSTIWTAVTLLIVLAGCHSTPQRLVCPAPTYDPPRFPLPPSQLLTPPDRAALAAYRTRIERILSGSCSCSK